MSVNWDTPGRSVASVMSKYAQDNISRTIQITKTSSHPSIFWVLWCGSSAILVVEWVFDCFLSIRSWRVFADGQDCPLSWMASSKNS